MITSQTLLDSKKFKGIISVSPDTLVYHALFMMNHSDIGSLAVLDGQKLVGVFSERDYARKGILQGRTSKKTMVKEIMTKELITVKPETELYELMEILTNNRVRHLPVMNDANIVVGILSIGDVVNSFLANQQWHIDMLHQYISS